MLSRYNRQPNISYFMISLLVVLPHVEAVISSLGKEFLIAVPVLVLDDNDTSSITFYMSGWYEAFIQVIITCPGYTGEERLEDLVTLEKLIPYKYVLEQTYMSNTKIGKKWSYRLVGSNSFGLLVLLMNRSPSVATFIAIPTSSWGKQYFAYTLQKKSSLQIISGADSNNIRMRLERSSMNATIKCLYNEYIEGDELKLLLNKYDAFALSDCPETMSTESALTGTSISGDDIFCVITGNTFSMSCQAPEPEGGRTYLNAEMVLPSTSYGKQFVLISMMNSVDIKGFILTTADKTTIEIAKPFGLTSEKIVLVKGISNVSKYPDALLTSNERIKIILYHDSGCADRRTGRIASSILTLLIPNQLFYVIYVLSMTELASDLSAVIVINEHHTNHLLLSGRDFRNMSGVFWHDVIGAPFKVSQFKILNSTTSVSTFDHQKFGCYIYGFVNSISFTHPLGFQDCTANGTSGDGIDNDCDLSVDEELEDGIDNDDDGHFDEDTRPDEVIDGYWSGWQAWACIHNGEDIFVSRKRSCDFPAPSNGGKFCVGDKRETTEILCPESLRDIFSRYLKTIPLLLMIPLGLLIYLAYKKYLKKSDMRESNFSEHLSTTV